MTRTVSLPQQLLLQGLQQQQSAVVNSYYQHLKEKVYPYFRARYEAHQLQELEDCFSDAFLLFLQKIKEANFYAANLDGYAFRIVQGKLRDRLKARAWLTTTAPEDIKEEAVLPTPYIHCFQDFLAAHGNDELVNWYNALPPKKQYLLALSLQGYKLNEAADYLGIAHGTARNWYSGMMAGAGKGFRGEGGRR